MSPPGLSKRDSTVAAILRRWRALTGGGAVPDTARPTLVACSAGPDSTGLALALHAGGRLAGLVHVVHDLRPPADALADRDAARELADRLGVPFLEHAAPVRPARPSGTGLEAAARHARYAALSRAAADAGIPWIATAHHADDQLETILMRLARGAGPAGLAGIRPRRRLAGGTTVIRPCLTTPRADLARLCAAAGVHPRTDATNTNTAFARNAVRATATELTRLYPGAAGRTAELARRMRETAAALDWAGRAAGPGPVIDRAWVRSVPAGVAHAGLRRIVLAALGGVGADALAWRVGDRIVRAARDRAGGERKFRWGPAVIVVGRGQLLVGVQS